MHPVVPCPLCGYHAPGLACPHCALGAREPSLAEPPAGRFGALADGLRALPMGFHLLATTRGTKRLMLPPVILTTLVFVAFARWVWSTVEPLLRAAEQGSADALGIPEGWLRGALEWLLAQGFVVALVKAGGVIAVLVVTSLAALWTFSVAYEAIAAPFLDELQGRLEARWFGRDPYKTVERPNDISERRILAWSLAAGGPALAGLVLWWYGEPPASRWWLLLPPLAFLAVSLAVRDYGAWLAWAARSQARTLWVSVKTSVLALFLLLCFVWLKFVPVIGWVLFAMVAGFVTALLLLDIPFSRRRYSTRQRLAFVRANALSVTLLGLTTSLVFVVPFLGPLLGVPAASVGGLWLLCRRDKNALRPRPLRIERTRAAR